MALFGKSKKKTVIPVVPNDVSWIRSPRNQFYNFLNLDPEEMGLKKASGVYVIWHGGMRPEWIYIGLTKAVESYQWPHSALFGFASALMLPVALFYRPPSEDL